MRMVLLMLYEECYHQKDGCRHYCIFAATCITGIGNMVIYSNVQIVLWWIVLIIPNIVGAVATFAYFVLGKKK